MRRQLKLQGQLCRPRPAPGQEACLGASGPPRLRPDGSDGERCERRRAGRDEQLWAPQEGGHAPRGSAEWEGRSCVEGRSSEELRSCSIAALRAKAREHEAEIHSGRRAPGGATQTQEAGVRADE